MLRMQVTQQLNKFFHKGIFYNIDITLAVNRNIFKPEILG